MIYLLRHTKPDVSDGICYGVSDLDLDPRSFREDISSALKALESVNFSAIYSSPLRRCKRLADSIESACQVVVDKRLMEMNFGDWEMLSWQEIFSRDEGKRWFDNFITTKIPGGESFEQMVERAASFLEDIDQSQDIVVVTHAGFVRAMMVASGKEIAERVFDIKVEYGEVIKLDI